MYHFQDEQLRVVREFCVKYKNILENSRLIIIEHILPTTEEFLLHLHNAGVEIFAIFSKPYSIDKSVSIQLINKYGCLYNHSYKEIEETPILYDTIMRAIEKSNEDNKKIVIIDVGGYFSKPLTKIGDSKHIVGVIEDTTFGHNRYYVDKKYISLPIFSVARSALKEIEARFVGRDAIIAMDMLLRDAGISLSGRKALVLGYGMIGTNVARSLMAHDLLVSVYDIRDIRNIHAFIDGFRIHKKRELLKESDIIFSATASNALTYEEILECKTNVILASVGSKTTEFDVDAIAKHALSVQPIKDNLVRYELPNSKFIVVAKGGAAVNFLLPSTPKEVLDLVFSEIVKCYIKLLSDTFEGGIIYELEDNELSEISKRWLIPMNQE